MLGRAIPVSAASSAWVRSDAVRADLRTSANFIRCIVVDTSGRDAIIIGTEPSTRPPQREDERVYQARRQAAAFHATRGFVVAIRAVQVNRAGRTCNAAVRSSYDRMVHDDMNHDQRIDVEGLTEAADRLDGLAEMADVMGDDAGAARLREGRGDGAFAGDVTSSISDV